MYTISIAYDVPTRTMSDGLTAKQRAIGTKGDSDVLRLHFDINDPNNELDGLMGRVDLDVPVRNDDGTTYRPYVMLDENNDAILPDMVMTVAKKFKLPVQMVHENEDQSIRLCSFNRLTYAVTTAVRGRECSQ